MYLEYRFLLTLDMSLLTLDMSLLTLDRALLTLFVICLGVQGGRRCGVFGGGKF